MNPHQSGPRTVSRSPKKNPSTGLGTHPETHGLLTPGRTTTSRHSRNQSFVGWPPAPRLDGGSCGVAAFRHIFFKGRKHPFWGGFLNEKLEGMQFFLCVLGDSDEKMKFEDNLKGLQKGKFFLIYMHCAWHCPTYTCTHFCKPKKSGWCLSKMSKQL